jgi:hypothetical protein
MFYRHSQTTTATGTVTHIHTVTNGLKTRRVTVGKFFFLILLFFFSILNSYIVNYNYDDETPPPLLPHLKMGTKGREMGRYEGERL